MGTAGVQIIRHRRQGAVVESGAQPEGGIMTGVTFTQESAKRIAKAVRVVEGQPPSRGGRNAPVPGQSETFWAQITGEEIFQTANPLTITNDSPPPTYSWI